MSSPSSSSSASSQPPLSSVATFDFDIDHYLNLFIPAPRLHRLPRRLSRFIGYRSHPQPSIAQPLVWLYAFVGAFISLSLISLVYRSLPPIYSHNGSTDTKTRLEIPIPIIVASFGATAILEFNSIASPLSQPRNLVFGQLFAAIVGTALTKLFRNHITPNPHHFQELRWLIGALAVGLSSMVMGFTKTVHPPAGATALLAATSDEIGALGWYLIPLVLLGNAVVVVVACLTNNIQRQWPLWWWTELSLSPQQEGPKDVEKARGSEGRKAEEETPESSHIEFLGRRDSELQIVISSSGVQVPSKVGLSFEDREFLDALRLKMYSKMKERDEDKN